MVCSGWTFVAVMLMSVLARAIDNPAEGPASDLNNTTTSSPRTAVVVSTVPTDLMITAAPTIVPGMATMPPSLAVVSMPPSPGFILPSMSPTLLPLSLPPSALSIEPPSASPSWTSTQAPASSHPSQIPSTPPTSVPSEHPSSAPSIRPSSSTPSRAPTVAPSSTPPNTSLSSSPNTGTHSTSNQITQLSSTTMSTSFFSRSVQNTFSTAETNTTVAESVVQSSTFYTTFPFFIGVGGFVLLVCCSIMICRCVCKRRKRARERQSVLELELSGGIMDPGDGEGFSRMMDDPDVLESHMLVEVIMDPAFKEPSYNVGALKIDLNALQVEEVLESQIKVMETIGSGSFGNVRRALYTDEDGDVDQVILKEVVAAASPRDNLVQMLREAVIMGQFAHKNVLQLIGVMYKNGSHTSAPIMVHEHMPGGPLDRYLRRTKPNLQELLQISKEILAGANYLIKREFALAYYATKNVMVGADGECKIADFGVSHDFSDSTYPLPKWVVPWCAPELFRDSDFRADPHWRRSTDSGLGSKSLSSNTERRLTFETAAWSLGVTLWEVFRQADVTPFQKFPAATIVQKIKQGIRLAPPDGCPRVIYKMMIDSWHPESNERPSVDQMVASLPSAVSAPTSASATYPDLMNVYLAEDAIKSAEDDVVVSHRKRISGVRDDDCARPPSPLIHQSLVGLTKSEGGTVSSRPSNYTSGTGTGSSAASRAFSRSSRRSFEDEDDVDDDNERVLGFSGLKHHDSPSSTTSASFTKPKLRPAFTSIFDEGLPLKQSQSQLPSQSQLQSQVIQDHRGALPTSLYRASSSMRTRRSTSLLSEKTNSSAPALSLLSRRSSVESAGYLMILPHQHLLNQGQPIPEALLRDKGDGGRDRANFSWEDKAEKRKSALALALGGVSDVVHPNVEPDDRSCLPSPLPAMLPDHEPRRLASLSSRISSISKNTSPSPTPITTANLAEHRLSSMSTHSSSTTRGGQLYAYTHTRAHLHSQSSSQSPSPPPSQSQRSPEPQLSRMMATKATVMIEPAEDADLTDSDRISLSHVVDEIVTEATDSSMRSSPSLLDDEKKGGGGWFRRTRTKHQTESPNVPQPTSTPKPGFFPESKFEQEHETRVHRGFTHRTQTNTAFVQRRVSQQAPALTSIYLDDDNDVPFAVLGKKKPMRHAHDSATKLQVTSVAANRMGRTIDLTERSASTEPGYLP
eukprot:m.196123 g.196123  ORF g.196123 m.196123 type:complete len:1198 (-) comp32606_c0_seq1:293-3886(-)